MTYTGKCDQHGPYEGDYCDDCGQPDAATDPGVMTATEVSDIMRKAILSHHAGLIESLRSGKIWPDIEHALHEAGLQIVPITRTN